MLGVNLAVEPGLLGDPGGPLRDPGGFMGDTGGLLGDPVGDHGGPSAMGLGEAPSTAFTPPAAAPPPALPEAGRPEDPPAPAETKDPSGEKGARTRCFFPLVMHHTEAGIFYIRKRYRKGQG